MYPLEGYSGIIVIRDVRDLGRLETHDLDILRGEGVNSFFLGKGKGVFSSMKKSCGYFVVWFICPQELFSFFELVLVYVCFVF